jgi:hypothetical protein
MSEKSSLSAPTKNKRELILRYGAVAFGLIAVTLWAILQAYLFHNPRYARLRLGFIVQDVFTATWVLFLGFAVWRLTQKNREVEKLQSSSSTSP